jgi:alkyl sulfatase BDS1-like metallo-beta-lactamase superfamily hydrolase
MTKTVLNDIQLGKTTLDKAVADGSAKIEGNAAVVNDFLASMDSFKFWFNIVTP